MPHRKPNDAQIHIWLPLDLYKQLRQMTQERGLYYNEAIIEALNEYFARHPQKVFRPDPKPGK